MKYVIFMKVFGWCVFRMTTAKSRIAHVPGMPGTFSPPPISKETAS